MMFDTTRSVVFELITVIVNFGMGNKVLRKAKEAGAKGGTIYIGRGVINNPFLNMLAVSDLRREIVLLVADGETSDHTMRALNETFHFERPHKGLAYSSSVCNIAGVSSIICHGINPSSRGEGEPMYHSITVIVEKGRAEDVIDAAVQAGSTGGTIINARGSGIHETSKIFSMDIEPEKEVAIILSKADKTQGIVSSIREHLNLDEPGHGLIFLQEINEVYGLRD